MSGGEDFEGQVAGVVLGEDDSLVWVGWIVADGEVGVAVGGSLGGGVGYGGAADVSAEVFAVEDEMEAGFDLEGAGEGGFCLLGWEDCPAVDLGSGFGPGGGEGEALLAFGFADAALESIQEEEAGHGGEFRRWT